MDIKQIAISYIKDMTNNEKLKLKAMLLHNVSCGRDYAIQNEIEPKQFNNELKLIFEGK